MNLALAAQARRQYGRADQAQGLGYARPTWTKWAGNPIFVQSDAAWLVANSNKMFWPCLVHARAVYPSALDEWYLYYSSDHGYGSGGAGTGLATAPHPTGPWTDQGVIYNDNTHGSEQETPHVIWDDANSRFIMYLQLIGAGYNQSTVALTSPNGVDTWTYQGIAIDVPDLTSQPGDGHTGYARIYKNGALYVAHHLMGGGNYPHFGVSYSTDGLSFTLDPRSIPARADLTSDGVTRRVEADQVAVFQWRGNLWTAYVDSSSVSGASANGKLIHTARYKDPFTFTDRAQALALGAPGAWDNDTHRQPHVVEHGSRLWMVYAAGGTDGNGAFGLAYAEV